VSLVKRPCIVHRCPEYAVPGESRCEGHRTKFEAERRANPALTGRRGTDAEWRRARGLKLWRQRKECGQNECEKCAARGALQVHHVDGDAKNHSQSNLMVLCESCHRRESNRPETRPC
jgi:5-methylcytosine-specific restriction endonuclease McrA